MDGCEMPAEKKRFRGTFFWLIFVAASFAGGYYFHDWKTFKQPEYSVKVVEVLDGDTIGVEWFGGVSRLRIVGIDTLETRHSKKLREQAERFGISEDYAYEMGQRAKQKAKDLLLDNTVTIKFPNGRIERDNFGRLLAYVYTGSSDYGIYLITQGLAYPREEDHVRDKYYEWPVIQAKNDKKGIYAN